MISTLTRVEVAGGIDGRGDARRVPIMSPKWVGPNIYENPFLSLVQNRLQERRDKTMTVVPS